MGVIVSIYKRGNVWWAEFSLNGKPVRKSTYSKNREEAERIHDEFRLGLSRIRGKQAIAKTLNSTDSEWSVLIDQEMNRPDNGIVGAIQRRVASRSKKKKLVCLLNREVIANILKSNGSRCSVTGADMNIHGPSAFKPSLDRLDNGLGYEIGNIRVVCAIANVAMNVWGELPLRDMCRAYTHKMLEHYSPQNPPQKNNDAK